MKSYCLGEWSQVTLLKMTSALKSLHDFKKLIEFKDDLGETALING